MNRIKHLRSKALEYVYHNEPFLYHFYKKFTEFDNDKLYIHFDLSLTENRKLFEELLFEH